MKIVITESQYDTIMNELAKHHTKNMQSLIKWIGNHTTCRVESSGTKFKILPPQDLYKGFYLAHDTESAVQPIINFLKNVLSSGCI